MLVKKLNYADIHHVDLESIFRFLPTTYIDKEVDTNFFYDAAFYGSNVKNFWKYEYTKKILPFLLKKKAKLVISQLREIPKIQDEHILMQARISYFAIEKYGVDPEQIIYILNSELNKELFCKTLIFPYYECDFIHRLKNNEFSLAKDSNRHHDILSMNGKPHKFFRLRHIIKLWQNNLHQNSIINILRLDEDKRLYSLDTLYESVSDMLSKKEFNIFFETFPNKCDNYNELYGKHHCGYPYDPKLFEKTKISIISETNAGWDVGCNDEFFITEKTVRAIGNRHPFIILSTPNFLFKLRQLGYQTFSKVINEDYDKIDDPYKRLDSAIESVDMFCKTYDSNMQKEIDKITAYNLNNLFERYKWNIAKLTEVLK